MNFYGLHFTSSDGTEYQFRLDTGDKDGRMQIWSRYARKNSAFGAWQRMDCQYMSDNTTIDAVVNEAVHAQNADMAIRATSAGSADSSGSSDSGTADSATVATRLSKSVSFTFTGDATGKINSFDGSKDVSCKLTVEDLADIKARLKAIEKTIKNLQEEIRYIRYGYGDDSGGGEGPGD